MSIIKGFFTKREVDKSAKGKISAIGGATSLFYIVNNYVSFLKFEDRTKPKGFVFLIVSIIYLAFCSWLYIENFVS